MKRPIALACVAALCLVLATAAGAFTVRITADGTGDLPDIQTALVACATGDTILVAPGIFRERIVWPDTDGLVLLGETTPEECILDGENTYRPISIITAVGETTVIKGLTIRNGGLGGIWCTAGSSPTIEGNVIRDNVASQGGGISCTGGASPLIVGNLITGNSVPGYVGGGIGIDNSSHPTIVDNQIVANHAQHGGGIGIGDGSSPTITDNLIADNSAGEFGGGLLIYGADDPCAGLVARNTIRANLAGKRGGGILTAETVTTAIRNNLFEANAADSSGAGLQLSGPGTTATVAGNLFLANVGPGGAGINVANGAAPVIDGNLLRQNLGDAIACASGGNPLVQGNDIVGHVGHFGLYNGDGAVMVMAEDNWWGDASGPYHAIANPAGSGDEVSDHVDFDPWSLTVGSDTPAAPTAAVLHQNRPNPFNPRTTIVFEIPADLHVRLTVYALDGQAVATLLDAPATAGRHELVWNGEDAAGHAVPSGVYFYRLTTGEFAQTNRMVLVR